MMQPSLWDRLPEILRAPRHGLATRGREGKQAGLRNAGLPGAHRHGIDLENARRQ